jgi:TPR repeat protein
VRWFWLAADQGVVLAQVNLGVMYENGLGVPQDYVQAHTWHNLAVSRLTGELRDSAVGGRDDVAGLMTSLPEWDEAHPREP